MNPGKQPMSIKNASVKKLYKEDFRVQYEETLKVGKDFYNDVRMILKNRKISQEKLAELMNVSFSYIKRMLNNRRPGYEDVLKICLALNLDDKLSGKLFKSASYILDQDKPDDYFIIMLMTNYSDWSYSKKIECLKYNKILA